MSYTKCFIIWCPQSTYPASHYGQYATRKEAEAEAFLKAQQYGGDWYVCETKSVAYRSEPPVQQLMFDRERGRRKSRGRVVSETLKRRSSHTGR